MKTATILLLGVIAHCVSAAADEKEDKEKLLDYAGMWFGKGETWEEKGEAGVRVIDRRADTEFWFRVSPEGEVVGQAYITYSGELMAMEWEVPVASAGSINAAVSGTSEKKTHKVDLAGDVSKAGKLNLKVVGENDDLTIEGLDFEFVITATVSMPIPIGGGSLDTGVAPNYTVIEIPAKAWSPFQGVTAQIEDHEAGAKTVDVTQEGEKFRIHWHATQVVPARIEQLQDKIEKLEKALAKLTE